MTDIVYQDSDVCILHPQSERGVVILHAYPAQRHHQIISDGKFKVGANEHMRHPYIFFRCPFRLVPTSSPCTESMITRAYDSVFYSPSIKHTNYFGIRVDPYHPFVYDSNLRHTTFLGIDLETASNHSRRPMPDFIHTMRRNNAIINIEK